MKQTITKFTDNKSGKKDWSKNGKSGTFTWYSCGAQFKEQGDKWFNGFIKDFELKAFGVQYPSEMIGKEVDVNLTQEEYQGQMKDKFELVVPKKDRGGFTDEDRKMLREIHQELVSKKQDVGVEELGDEDVPF